VHRLKESLRQHYRWAPHTIGVTAAKPKDYEQIAEGEADSPYILWQNLQKTETPLQLGDILETETGELRIYKYVGFEEAQWQLPEVKTTQDAAPPTETTPPVAN
jgi:hypothetical protein